MQSNSFFHFHFDTNETFFHCKRTFIEILNSEALSKELTWMLNTYHFKLKIQGIISNNKSNNQPPYMLKNLCTYASSNSIKVLLWTKRRSLIVKLHFKERHLPMVKCCFLICFLTLVLVPPSIVEGKVFLAIQIFLPSRFSYHNYVIKIFDHIYICCQLSY